MFKFAFNTHIAKVFVLVLFEQIAFFAAVLLLHTYVKFSLLPNAADFRLNWSHLALMLFLLAVPYFLRLWREREALLGLVKLYSAMIFEYGRKKNHVVSDWFDEDKRDRDVPFLASESHSSLSQLVLWLQVVTEAFVVVLFFSGTLGLIFGVQALVSVYVAFLLGLWFSRWSWKKSASLEKIEGAAQSMVSLKLLSSWDNIVLQNTISSKNWEKGTLASMEALEKGKIKSLVHFSSVRTVLYILVLFPVIFRVILQMFPAELKNLTPEQLCNFLFFLLLGIYSFPHFFSFYRAVNNFVDVFGGFLRVLRACGLHPIAKNTEFSCPEINWKKLNFMHDGLHLSLSSFEEVMNITDNFSPGRYYVLGPPGCGKTTFLVLLKQHFLEQSFFLPGQNTLSFGKPTDDIFDPAERVEQSLKYVFENSSCPLILLDDWDVYLTPELSNRVNQMIENVSQIRCVFESKRTK